MALMTDIAGEYNPADKDNLEEEIVETEQDEALESVEEFLQDGADTPETETAGEPFIFTRVDENGNEVEEQYTQDEILQAMDAFKAGVPTDPNYETIRPFIEQVRNDELLKNILSYKAGGHSNAEIIDGLFLLRHPEYANINPQHYAQIVNQQQAKPQQPAEEPVPEFETIADEIKYWTAKATQQPLAEIKNMISQLSGKTAQIEQQRMVTETVANNDRVLAESLARNNIDASALSDAELGNLYTTMNALWPGVDFNTFRLVPQQADILIKSTFGARTAPQGITGQMRSAQQQADTRQIITASKAPKVLPGTRPSSNPKAKATPNDWRELRRQRVDEFFNNI